VRGPAVKTQPLFHRMREDSPASATGGAAGLDPLSIGGESPSHEKGTMGNVFPVVYLARHGETEWSLTGQHTGLTDLPLTQRGEQNARALRERLAGLNFKKVFTSPLQRATRTCELAGFWAVAEVDRNLLEWDYGQYEGLTTAEIHAQRPDWLLFRDGCPGGESPEQAAARADSMVDRVRTLGTHVLLFSSGHFLRVLAARWLALGAAAGKYLLLSTASVSAQCYENGLSGPVIQLWNDTRHVKAPELRGTAVQTQSKETSLWPQRQ
jgi:broad specificity phosphatase PhoE